MVPFHPGFHRERRAVLALAPLALALPTLPEPSAGAATSLSVGAAF